MKSTFGACFLHVPIIIHLCADLVEGMLDPFPLLRVDSASERNGRAQRVNPLLLVTEKKGTSWCLHYGAFPLDAFNTDGTNIGRM